MNNSNIMNWTLLLVSGDFCNLLNDFNSFCHLTEHNMLIIEMRNGSKRDKELRSISVLPVVGHR